MTEPITYRMVREWVCINCGVMNYELERDVLENGVMLCWKCNSEFELYEEVE